MRKIGPLLVPALLGAMSLAWTVPRLDDVGVTIDEPQYFFSVERIQDWYALLARQPGVALRDSTIRAAWDPPDVRYYNPHPPAYKQLMAITEGLSGRTLGAVAGYRLAPALLFAVLVATVSSVGWLLAGPVTSIGAGLALFAMPRVVGHAHIGATDLPLTVFWFMAAIGFAVHAFRGGRGTLLVAGTALGFAMATKFTGWLLPAAILPWCLLERRWRGFLAWLAIGMLVAWLLTPPAWMHPVREFVSLLGTSLSRDVEAVVSTRYLGTTYGYVVPWHYPFVMTLVTVPIGVLVLAAAGGISFLRARRNGSGDGRVRVDLETSLSGLCILQIGFFLALIAFPKSPSHDGVRLWLPMFPFVALIAGIGLHRIWRVLDRRPGGRSSLALAAAVFAVFLLPGLRQTVRVSPFHLSYYNGWIGGLPGAAKRGMEISYWCDSVTPGLLREIQERVPIGGQLYGHPSRRYLVELQALGLLRRDLQIGSTLPSRYLLLTARTSFMPDRMRRIYEHGSPVAFTELDGVTLSGLYVRHDETMDGAGPAEEAR